MTTLILVILISGLISAFQNQENQPYIALAYINDGHSWTRKKKKQKKTLYCIGIALMTDSPDPENQPYITSMH